MLLLLLMTHPESNVAALIITRQVDKNAIK